MSGFRRPGRSRIETKLQPQGRGSIHAALFDLGIYPAAVPADDGRVWGEVYRMLDVGGDRSEEHTSELQSHSDLVCRLLLEKKKINDTRDIVTEVQTTL